jgi:hypothetical protein
LTTSRRYVCSLMVALSVVGCGDRDKAAPGGAATFDAAPPDSTSSRASLDAQAVDARVRDGTAPGSVDAATDKQSADQANHRDVIDAGNAASRCGAMGDYLEQSESSNQGFSFVSNGRKLLGTGGENTGFALGTTWTTRTIGGCESPDERGSFGSLALWDTDVYAFDVSAPTTASFSLHWTAPLGRALMIYSAGDGSLVDYRENPAQADFDIPPLDLPTGRYYLVTPISAPEAGRSPPYTRPQPYQITFTRFTGSCQLPIAGAAGNYTERDESGSGHRANDMFSVTWSPSLGVTPTVAMDVPESTGLVVANGTRFVLRGKSALVSPVDDYLDRDTFEFSTGNDVSIVYVRANWAPGKGDMDLLFIELDGDTTHVTAWATASSDPEEHGFRVKPNTRYWIWAAQINQGTPGALDYAIALCGNK